MKKDISLQILYDQKLVPLYYHEDAEISLSIMYALYDAGIRTIEYTNRGQAALSNFKILRKNMGELPGLQLGAGTIKSPLHAQQFIDAGSDFIICPSINEEVGRLCEAANLLWIPGCTTPTEISIAENAQATIVKIFPGSLLGPGYISAIKPIFPDLSFMVTGGIEIEENNLTDWFKSGASVVGLGSKLVSKNMVDNKNFEELKISTAQALKLVRQSWNNAQ